MIQQELTGTTECDRAFTRSDALAKHMRTVHDTEPLRPSDPIPKTQTAKQKLKFINKQSSSLADDNHPSNGVSNGTDVAVWTSSFPTELGFTAEEEARGSKELYRLLRRQVHWAEEEGVSLKQQCEALESLRHQEWIEKEVLLNQVIVTELSWNQRKLEVLAGTASLPSGDALRAAAAVVISPDKDLPSFGAIQTPPAIPILGPSQPLP